MTADNRQPKGVPAGGQFAASTHGEPGVSLSEASRPELDGWPEALYPPNVRFHVSDEGRMITETTDISGDFIQVWEKSDGSGAYDGHALGEWDGADDDDIEQAQSWLTGRHKVIAAAVRAEETAAVERARARILAIATGEAKPATDEELSTTIDSYGDAARQALRHVELASAGLAARKILAAHPDAVYAEIQTDSWDNGEFVAGAIVKDAGYDTLQTYFADDDEATDATREVVGLLKNLDAQPQNAHWSGAFSTGSYGEDLYMIDLQKAAAWSPADEAFRADLQTPEAQAEKRPCTNGPWCTAPRGTHVEDCEMGSTW
ncbi:hypothetical protein [Arthrobacter sp. UYCo732]|uniref:hypothetical protein n=1 Tax=Arthrobacter sp. UYCo732 TaxID=3156336 RepID=UPI00339573EE